MQYAGSCASFFQANFRLQKIIMLNAEKNKYMSFICKNYELLSHLHTIFYSFYTHIKGFIRVQLVEAYVLFLIEEFKMEDSFLFNVIRVRFKTSKNIQIVH